MSKSLTREPPFVPQPTSDELELLREDGRLFGPDRQASAERWQEVTDELWDRVREDELLRAEREASFEEAFPAMVEAWDDVVNGKDPNIHEPVVEIVKKR